LDPPGHPLRYSVGGQFLYAQVDNQGATAQWFEYDIWLGVAHKDWKNLIPYGGIVYSRVDGNMRNFPSKPALDEFRSPTAFEIFMGVGWAAYRRVWLGIDARLFGENSGTFSLTYRF
jgi:hypothetical protein